MADGSRQVNNQVRMVAPGARQERRPWWRGSSRRAGNARRYSPHEQGSRRRSPGSELALIVRAKRGGPRDREELIEAFLPLIANVARAYWRPRTIDRDELTQEGVVGLLRALERFEPERGVPFWGYAAWWVHQSMQQVVSELSRPIVLSDRALRQLARIRAAQRRLEQAHVKEASPADVAKLVGLPQAQVESLICAERRPRPLDEPANEESGDGTTLGDQLADPPAEDAYDRVPARVLAAELPRLLELLNDRERTVICFRFGIGGREHTLREVAKRLSISAERVRQIEQASLEKLHGAALRAA